MKTSALLLSALAALSQAASFTNSEINPVAGEPFELTWSGASGPVSIVLRSGDPKNLKTVTTLASGLTGGSTTITLDPEELPSGNYAFMIVDSSGENYSELFPFQGNAAALPSGTAATTTGSSRPTTSATDDEEPTPTSEDDEEEEEETGSTTRPSSPSRTTSSTSATNSVPGAAPSVSSSPLALILVTIAAMFYFN